METLLPCFDAPPSPLFKEGGRCGGRGALKYVTKFFTHCT